MDMDASAIKKWFPVAVAGVALTIVVAALFVFGKNVVDERRMKTEDGASRWFATSTDEDLQETPTPDEEYAVPEPAPSVGEFTLPTSTMTLIRPQVERFRRMAKEPTLLAGESGARVPVLMYHHIRPFTKTMDARHRRFTVTPGAFEAQMIGLVRAGFHTVTPDELLAAMQGRGVLPEKPVMITFDDSFRDQYTNAYPVLKRLGLKAAFFVVTQSYRQRGAMTQEMIRELDRSGIGYIASHTQHHAYLTRYKKETRAKEIADSKKDLEALLGHSVVAFAYPYGSVNDEVRQEVEDAGYAMAFGVRLGSLHAASSLFDLRRMSVFEKEDVAALAEGFSR